MASGERPRPVPARIRPSAVRPVGPGPRHRLAPPEAWLALRGPAIIRAATGAAAPARLARHRPRACRHNPTQASWRRGVVRGGPWHLACPGRRLPPGAHDDLGRGRSEAWRAAPGERGTARVVPARPLEALVWQDRCRILRAPALSTPARARAPGGAWRPHALPARRKTRRDALTPLERQHARRLAVSLAELIGRNECARTRAEVTQTPPGWLQPLRQLEAQAQHQVDGAAWAQGVAALCQRGQPTFDQRTLAPRRPLGEWRSAHVSVTTDQGASRDVGPTGPKGATTPCCPVRVDDLHGPALLVRLDEGCRRELRRIRHQAEDLPGLAVA
jgi:hypothetical protein